MERLELPNHEITLDKFLDKINELHTLENSEDYIISFFNNNPNISLFYIRCIPTHVVAEIITERVFIETLYGHCCGIFILPKLKQTERMCLHFLEIISESNCSYIDFDKLFHIDTPLLRKEINRKKLLCVDNGCF